VNYLLDTNIVSELRKGERSDARVRQWFDAVPDEALSLSVLVTGELRIGVERRRPCDPLAAQVLEQWLNGIERMTYLGQEVCKMHRNKREAKG